MTAVSPHSVQIQICSLLSLPVGLIMKDAARPDELVRSRQSFLLGLVDGAFEFLLQLLHAADRRRVFGRRLLVQQFASRLGVLRLHHL